ncbi:MAG TPA: hypothetical protein DCQ26_08910 [Marinilabiliales bacterium]|nr:MAG: hypothetical protein A2W96_13975 [Bacteroidetes bacterium GWD2_40_43]OFX91189.1 MAG: hypothetical protein A2W97_14645 [Bacteroidetes bacterium GWE2_40_63]OFY22865.1 MAG: hypothetical protein A2W88_08740 [Bacteroidetes bacterium GWF2_40_13]OFZ25897.1 MAG: hypothetical protein A2437_16980 [Bacteroidetes bacterium RIFOXYC2_FULL_40_12]HAM98720.1 hypothetical protein [Marinilabiliales bacterium]
MQDINKYISGLLFIHDCVILPGFGGFVTNYQSARHNELSHTFYPPQKDLIFNKNLTYNDGLLINYLAKNHHIPYTEAEERIQNEVQKAWLLLEKGEPVVFEGVGTFQYDKNQNLTFTPAETENFLTDAYGMSSFRFPPLNYQKNGRDIIPLYNSQNMNEGVKKTLKIAAIVVPIVGVLTLIPLTRDYRNQQTAGYTFIDTNIEEPIEATHSAMAEDSNMEVVLDNSTDKRQALFYTEEPKPVIVKQNTDGLTFYIIGGSYKDETNATIHAEAFRKKGFEAQVLHDNDLYRVSLATFDNKVNALHELRRIRSEEENDQVWLFSK